MNYNSQVNSFGKTSNNLQGTSSSKQIKRIPMSNSSIFNRINWMKNLYSGYEDLFSSSSNSYSNGYSNYTGGYLNNNNSGDYFYNKYNSSSNNQQSEIIALLKELVGSFFNKNQWQS